MESPENTPKSGNTQETVIEIDTNKPEKNDVHDNKFSVKEYMSKCVKCGGCQVL